MWRISKYSAIILAVYVLNISASGVNANTPQEQHWLYKVIPQSRNEARGVNIITWAIFGNDMDGIFGERSMVPTYGEINTRNFVRWWIRNPFHNLAWHVLNWNHGEAYVLIEIPGGKKLFWREHRDWIADGRQFQIVLIPFFVSWRMNEWEGYFGWRSGGGLGIAFRRM